MDLEELVKRLQADKAIVVLQTFNTVNVRLEWGEKHNYVQRFKALPTYNNIIRETAAKYSTILVDHDAHWRKNAADYLAVSNVAAVGGTWLGKAEDLENDAWDKIETLIKEASDLAKSL